MPELDNICGFYMFGSYLWNSQDKDSDLDYIIVIKEGNNYEQINENNKDFHIFSKDFYKEEVQRCNEMALSAFIQQEPFIKCNIDTEFKDLDLSVLRNSFSSKASNSYVKAKKKYQQQDIKLGYKSMYHSIRILILGKEIAKSIKKNKNLVNAVYSYPLGPIKKLFLNEDWDEINSITKPIFNRYASEFREVAPKPPKKG